MSIRKDEVQLRITIVSDKAKRELSVLDQEAYKLREQLKGLKKGTQDYADASKRLVEVNNKMAALRKEAGLNSLTLKQLNEEAKRLRMMRDHITPGTAAFRENERALRAVEARMNTVRTGMGPFAAAWKKVSMEAKGFLAVMVGQLAFTKFFDFIGSLGKQSDKIADIQRVAALSREEVDKLNHSLADADTRTFKSDLLDIVVVSGKLGIAKKDLEGFTLAVDQLVVSLGDELGSAENITDQLGKILNVFDGHIDEKNITSLGNAMVYLSNSGISTAAFISDFGQRLSGIAELSDLSLGAVLGFGAGVQEMGGRVESGATAIQKIIISIGKDVPNAARVANLELKEFQKLFANTPEKAIIAYAEGLAKNKNSFEEIALAFKDAGEDGQRVIEILSKIGQNAGFFQKRIDQASAALKRNTEIAEAFKLKNTTLNAIIAKMSKDWSKFWNSPEMINSVKNIVSGLASLVRWLKEHGKAVLNTVKVIGLLITAYTAYKLAAFAALLPARLQVALLNLKTAAILRAQSAEIAYMVITARSTTVTHLFNLAMKSTPWGFVISMLATAVAAYYMFRDSADEAKKAQIEFQKNVREEVGTANALFAALRKTNPESAERNRLMDYMNSKYGITLKNYADEKVFLDQIAKAQGNVVQALKEKIAFEMKRDALSGMLKKQMEEEIKYAELTKKYAHLRKTGEYKGEPILGIWDNNQQLSGPARDNNELMLAERVLNQKKLLSELQNQINETGEAYTNLIEKGASEEATPNKGGKIKYAPYAGGATDDKDKKDKTAEIADYQITEYNRLQAELRKIRMAMQEDLITANDKELAAVHEKYKALLDSNEKNIQDLRALEAEGDTEATRQIAIREEQRKEIYEAQEVEISATFRKQFKIRDTDRKAAEDKIAEGILGEHERKIQAIIKHYDELLVLARQYGLELTAIEKAKADAIAELNKKAAEETAKDWKDKMRQTMTHYHQAISSLANGIETVMNAMSRMVQDNNEAELARFRKVQDLKTKKLDDMLNKGIISQELYNQKKLQLDDNYAKKEAAMKLDAWEKQHEADIITGIIRAALAVLAGLMTQPFWPVGVAAGVAAAAAGAAEVAVIANQSPPEFGQGGYYLQGPSHNSKYGGMPVIDPTTGQAVALLEGKEVILSAATVQKNPNIVNDLVKAGQEHGGNLGDVYRRKRKQINFDAVSKNMDTTAYARGGYFGAISSTINSTPNHGKAGNRSNNQALEDKLDKLIAITQSKNENLNASVSLNDLKQKQILYNKIQNLSKI